MVGFLHNQVAEQEEEKEEIKVQNPTSNNDPLDISLPEIENLSSIFSDSFFDFDSIDSWLIGDPNMAELGDKNPIDFGELGWDYGENLGVKDDSISKKDEVQELSGEKGETCNVEIDKNNERVLSDLIEKQLEKVSLDGASNCLGSDAGGVVSVTSGGDGNVKSGENVSDKYESSDDESSSSSSSSSLSSSEEDFRGTSGEKKAKNTEMEEGEIMLSDADEMVAWSDDEDGESGTVGPIKSKNELKELPLVPPVTVTLQPYHQTVPVGIVLSILGAQVIVEGFEEHNPLTEGSILWITESRLPLGIIDEIFGPVKNPYYIVRYNSESEIPNGIQQGSTLISFVQYYANHILKDDPSLRQKGYDASGEHDEEISDDLEFSDDEKEAEHKRKLKTNKRGTKEFNNKPVTKRTEKKQLKNHNNHNRGAKSQENHVGSSGLGPDLGGDQPVAPSFPQNVPSPVFCAPNGIWSNGFPNQQQSLGLPNGLPPNGIPWMQQQNQHQQPYQLYQTPLQMSAIPGTPFNFNALSGQLNFGGAPGFAPWPACLPQSVLNQSQFGMSLPGSHAQAVQSQGSRNDHNVQLPPGNSENPVNLNQGRGGGGRRGHHRGRGRFGGGRGRYYSH